jgi:hypothetical protein
MTPERLTKLNFKGKRQMKESTKELKGRVGEVITRNISKKSDWERGTLGTRPEKSRTHGDTLILENSKQSNHTPGLTEFEQNSGHDPRIRRGSPIVGSGKRFGK